MAHTRLPGILVVDDEPPLRAMMDAWLRRIGFAVWLAADGRQALDLYRANQPQIDLVLLDVRMPGMDGPETLRALREINPAVRFCFMTGHSGSHTFEELAKLGAVHVLLKPFALEEVGKFLLHLAHQPPPNP